MQDVKMMYIFMLGVLLSLLFYMEEMIEEQEYEEKSWYAILGLAIIKALLGGVLIVLMFYTLQELKISFTVFDIKIVFGLWANLFIAGTISVFGSDFFKMIKRRAAIVAGGK